MEPQTIKKWNPWWVQGRVPKELLGESRDDLLRKLKNLSRVKEIVGVTGIRRGGKSTMLYQLADALLSEGIPAKNILYFNFDEPLPNEGAYALDEVYNAFLELNNPAGRQYLIFDEIQNVANWERWIKTRYDMQGEKLKFFVTGSNTSMLSDGLAKLLTGRMLPVEVYPLSFPEYLSFKAFNLTDPDLQKEEIKHHLANYLENGGFPEAVLEGNPEINRQRLREYYNSILFRDIVATRGIKESAKLAELSTYLATNVSTPFSYNKISQAIGLNINTLKEYIHFLEQAYLVHQVSHFSYSMKETLAIQRPKKTYFTDNGMRNAIAARFSPDTGRLAENLVSQELRRRGLETYFWKDKNEVDLIAKGPNGALQAINVTYGDKIDPRETRSLKEFAEKHRNTTQLIITKNIEKKEDGIEYVPLWKWLLAC